MTMILTYVCMATSSLPFLSLDQITVTTSLPYQPAASHCLSSASTSSSASTHSGILRLDPLDHELLKGKKKRKHIRGLRKNKVQPVEEAEQPRGAPAGWEEVPRRHSSGVIKLHSSRENLVDSQRASSEDDVLVRHSSLPPLLSELPSVASKSVCCMRGLLSKVHIGHTGLQFHNNILYCDSSLSPSSAPCSSVPWPR